MVIMTPEFQSRGTGVEGGSLSFHSKSVHSFTHLFCLCMLRCVPVISWAGVCERRCKDRLMWLHDCRFFCRRLLTDLGVTVEYNYITFCRQLFLERNRACGFRCRRLLWEKRFAPQRRVALLAVISLCVHTKRRSVTVLSFTWSRQPTYVYLVYCFEQKLKI